jgi:hypothetical protein
MSNNQMTAMSEAYGVMSDAMYQDRVTFKRAPASSKTAAGGNLAPAPVATTSDVPCRYRPANGREIQQAEKPIAGVAYMIFVPSTHLDDLVDVDARCVAVLAARTGGEVSRTFNVVAPLRTLGIEIEVLVGLEG